MATVKFDVLKPPCIEASEGEAEESQKPTSGK